MKKNIMWVIMLLLLVNLVVLDIFIFKMNNAIKELDNGVEKLKDYAGYHEKIETKEDEILCVGNFSGENKTCPEGSTATECESRFEIKDNGMYDLNIDDISSGDTIFSFYGDYELNKNNLIPKTINPVIGIKPDDGFEKFKPKEIHQAKDCSYIEVDDVKYNKVSEE